jgi:hypothetical protein
MYKISIPIAVAVLALSHLVSADETQRSNREIRLAVERAIPLIEAGSAGSAEERTCFTCHNQAVPIMALTQAKRRGFTIDEANLERQMNHTLAHLERGKANYLKGKGQGGQSITAGYALWALDAGGHEPDETTAAIASFLLQYQKASNHWSRPGKRPPSSGSDFTATFVALRGLADYGTDELQPAIDSRFVAVREWLTKAKPRDTEDLVFRLRALTVAKLDDKVIEQAVSDLWNPQRDDGGWAQTKELESDAYATGSALVALMQAESAKLDDKRLQRGLQFLLDTQNDDGSWHVVTRAVPFQEYFETGFPHDEDQYISIAASSWATLALVLATHDRK